MSKAELVDLGCQVGLCCNDSDYSLEDDKFSKNMWHCFAQEKSSIGAPGSRHVTVAFFCGVLTFIDSGFAAREDETYPGEVCDNFTEIGSQTKWEIFKTVHCTLYSLDLF